MVMFVPMISEFSDEKKFRNTPKKIMIFCDKFEETRCSMIVISHTCDRVNSY